MASNALVLAIDPGRDKCGLAVVRGDGAVLAREIVRSAELAANALRWARQFPAARLVMGQGTGARLARQALQEAGLKAVPVREEGTTLAARERYYRDHPPRGWRRLVPRSLQVPPVPLDDYAAVLIAEKYLAEQKE